VIHSIWKQREQEKEEKERRKFRFKKKFRWNLIWKFQSSTEIDVRLRITSKAFQIKSMFKSIESIVDVHLVDSRTMEHKTKIFLNKRNKNKKKQQMRRPEVHVRSKINCTRSGRQYRRSASSELRSIDCGLPSIREQLGCPSRLSWCRLCSSEQVCASVYLNLLFSTPPTFNFLFLPSFHHYCFDFSFWFVHWSIWPATSSIALLNGRSHIWIRLVAVTL
jgi:hypothetical protein